MAPAVGEQALWFAWAIALGAALGLAYDFLRALRRAAPWTTVPADLTFLGLTAFSLAWLGLYLCRGKLDLFQLGGLAAGAAAYFLLLGKPLGRLFRAFWHTVARGFHLLLWPWKMLGKKSKFLQNFSFQPGENGV